MTRTSRPDFEAGTLNAYVVEPGEVKDGDRYGYKLVATVEADYWCVHKGPTGWSDAKIELNGDAVRENLAKLLFPTLAHGRLYNG